MKADSPEDRAGVRMVVICGPTAGGKSRAAVTLALKADAEIISADSVQVYRGLDIGSAKPSPDELQTVRHHLVDVVRPDEPMTAARYAELALEAVSDILSRGKALVVAGGTGLYIKALVHGLILAPSADEELRERLLAEEESQGYGTLHGRLAQVDPGAAGQLHPADLVRIVRALEVYELTGERMSELQRDHAFQKSRFDARYVGLDPGPEALRERIEARVRAMLEAGLVSEVKGLVESGYGPELRPLSSPGYRQIAAHLASEITLDEAAESICRDHRRYARRQRVWFRAIPDVQWHDGPDDLDYGALAAWLHGGPSTVKR